ncbi:hypothetical protein [Phenylobacterium sp.]|uniref:hypothetical protein n=1 Tax=Phenylobacterium sp. TaxID=1871053 RepID=UPI002733981C|nr:hypothetical protein [Phenylobacterium sp.]MDP3854654.1 hypothetical protein [Phenylobacterium sp.]
MMMGNAYPPFSAASAPSNVSGSSSSSSVTSNTATAVGTGGSGSKSYAWNRVSGSSAISPDAATSAATAFSAALASGAEAAASFACTITDNVTGQVLTTNTVAVYLQRSNPPLSLSMSGSGAKTQTSSGTITVTSDGVTLVPSGGVPPYLNYSHAGAGDFTINGPGSATSTHSRALGPGGGVSGTVHGSVEDSIGQTAGIDYGVVLINDGTAPPPLSASVNPSSIDGYASGIVVVTDSVTATPSGGSGSYASRSWTRTSGDGAATSSSSDTTAFTANVGFGETVNGTFQYQVTDSLGSTATTTVSVSFTNWGTPPGGWP